MIQTKMTVILGVIAIAVVSACSKPEAEKPPESVNTAKLSAVLSKTKDALTAKDVAKATTEFKQFDEVWEKIEDGVKVLSPDAYKKIEDAMGAVDVALRKKDIAKATVAVDALASVVTASTTFLK